MKKNIYPLLIAIIALLFTIPTQGMNKKRGNDLIASINTIINNLKTSQIGNSDRDTISSPAIQKEQGAIAQKALKAIMRETKELDIFINSLSPNKRTVWKNKQSEILESAKAVLNFAITDNITATWQEHGKSIAQAALNIVIAGVGTAAIGLVTQGIQMGTGNLLALDTNTLLITGLSSATTAALTALSGKSSTFLPSISSSAFSESLITPSVTNNTFTLTMPSSSGPIACWIISEAMILARTMIEQGGGIGKMLGTIHIKQTLLPSMNKQLGTPSNTLVAAVSPSVQAIVKNKKIASVLTEIGWIIMQSGAVGGILHMAGFGYADTSMAQSIGYAVLTGVGQGTLSSVITLGNTFSPGSIITITSAPLAQQAFVIAGGTQQGAVTAVIQATVTEVSNILIETSKKEGGLLQTLQKGKELLGQSIRSRWSGTWATIVDAWETIQSIEPLPI